MIQSLPQPSREHPDPREELDRELDVGTWVVPFVVPIITPAADVPAGAPSWWQGDEEASSSFLRAMNVDA